MLRWKLRISEQKKKARKRGKDKGAGVKSLKESRSSAG